MDHSARKLLLGLYVLKCKRMANLYRHAQKNQRTVGVHDECVSFFRRLGFARILPDNDDTHTQADTLTSAKAACLNGLWIERIHGPDSPPSKYRQI